MAIFSLTQAHPCPCGSISHSYVEASDDTQANTSQPVLCWRCDTYITSVPGLWIWTNSTATGARQLRMADLQRIFEIEERKTGSARK